MSWRSSSSPSGSHAGWPSTETEEEATPTQAAGQVAGRAVLLVPQRERGTDEAILPEDYQRIMEVVRRADRPVMVKQVCAELGMSCDPARAEALGGSGACHSPLGPRTRSRRETANSSARSARARSPDTRRSS
ncbi:hypothetical protein [Streptomyces himalayensis]|uniref:hypothetical protein n=1 Tax=Streptomyces himalayensis TaxID=2820085 RepID=UPI00215DBDCE|nr:hypothetical protein [Streptomyces himalayensis]